MLKNIYILRLNSIFSKRTTENEKFLHLMKTIYPSFPFFPTGKVQGKKENKKVKVGGVEIEGEKTWRRKKQSPVFR